MAAYEGSAEDRDTEMAEAAVLERFIVDMLTDSGFGLALGARDEVLRDPRNDSAGVTKEGAEEAMEVVDALAVAAPDPAPAVR